MPHTGLPPTTPYYYYITVACSDDSFEKVYRSQEVYERCVASGSRCGYSGPSAQSERGALWNRTRVSRRGGKDSHWIVLPRGEVARWCFFYRPGRCVLAQAAMCCHSLP